MSYLLQNNKNRNSRNFFSSGIFIFFVALLVVGLLFFSLLNPLFIKIGGSLSQIFQNIPFADYFRSKGSLIDENNFLKDQVNTLTSENADRQSLSLENAKLNDLLSRGQPKNSIVAKVLEKPGFSPYDVLTLDVGSEKGVVVGDKVLFSNIALGQIAEVGSGFSKARLFSSSGNKFNAVLGDTKSEAEAEGQGGGGFEILLPKGVMVKEGDPVVLPQISTKVFGFVKSVSNLPGDVFQKIFFSLPVNLNEIDFVSIEK